MMKEWAKRVVRPVTRRVFARVDARVTPISRNIEDLKRRIDPLAEEVAAMREHFGPAMARVQSHDKLVVEHSAALRDVVPQVAALNDYLPIVLNNLSSQNAVQRELRRTELELRREFAEVRDGLPSGDEWAHLHKRLDELGAMLAERIASVEQRAEFIRGEVMFEARYGSQDKGLRSTVEPRVVSPDKLAALGDDIRLNLGCGHIPVDGFLNVDARPLDGVDVIAEVGDLPFEPASVSHIHSAHLLEHFPVEELRRRLLPYWLELLKPGATFSAVVPDSEKMIEEFVTGRFSFDDLRMVTYGEQEYDGDFHFNMFSRSSLCELLEETGFADVVIVEVGRRNGACYEMEVKGQRPSDHG